MKKGFVTFINNSPVYLALHEVLIDSILTFTDLEVEVLGINFSYKHENKRVISKRLDLTTENYDTICYAKIYASSISDFDLGIQLDADMILTPETVSLFDEIDIDQQYIIGSKHPQDPNNQQDLMQYLGVLEKSQPYIHATYLFSKNSKAFLQECYDLSLELLSKNFRPYNVDETVLNCMLWKNRREKNYVEAYDPHFSCFLDKGEFAKHYPQGRKHICHGCKDPNYARFIFNKLKREYGK